MSQVIKFWGIAGIRSFEFPLNQFKEKSILYNMILNKLLCTLRVERRRSLPTHEQQSLQSTERWCPTCSGCTCSSVCSTRCKNKSSLSNCCTFKKITGAHQNYISSSCVHIIRFPSDSTIKLISNRIRMIYNRTSAVTQNRGMHIWTKLRLVTV